MMSVMTAVPASVHSERDFHRSYVALAMLPDAMIAAVSSHDLPAPRLGGHATRGFEFPTTPAR
jgi:hypothetical protein